MKKLLLILITAVMLIGCKKNNEGTLVVIPNTPTQLKGQAANQKITLTWIDNSTNETGFKIERKSGLNNYTLIATLGENISTFNDAQLEYNTTYSYRVYAYNFAGNSINYSNELTLTTNSELPILTTLSIDSLSSNMLISGGNIISAGSTSIISKGVCWSTNPSPLISLNTKTTDGAGNSSFSSWVSGLTANTTYYLRAYATNSSGTAYGNTIIFTTPQTNVIINLPYVSTSSIGQINSSSATCFYSVEGIGITSRGTCWSTSPNPTIANSKTVDGSGTGQFYSIISGLNSNTTYYARAYATNSLGTTYGSIKSFTTTASTNAGLPTLNTADVTYKRGSIFSGGNVIDNGAAIIANRGVCLSKTINPTINDLKISVTGTTGSFETILSNLEPNTTYYVRSFATNSFGTAYGNQLSFNTGAKVVGNSYNGGVIAYVFQKGDPGYVAGEIHGIIAAPVDQTSAKWGCDNSSIRNTSTAIGTGNTNSINIATVCGSTNIAARICNDLILNGYYDWYLPSKDELNKLILNRNLIGGFSVGLYWSSSESAINYAHAQGYFEGSKIALKSDANRVRAVRSF